MQFVSNHDNYMITESPSCYYLIMIVPCLERPGTVAKSSLICFVHFSGNNLQDRLGYNPIGSLHFLVFTLHRRFQRGIKELGMHQLLVSK